MLPRQRLHHDIKNGGSAVTVLSSIISGGTLLIAFTLMALEVEYFWITFILGFGIVLPTAIGLVASKSRTETRNCGPLTESRSRSQRESGTALETLRHRYAQGDLSDAEFEHRVERLLESDSSENPKSPLSSADS